MDVEDGVYWLLFFVLLGNGFSGWVCVFGGVFGGSGIGMFGIVGVGLFGCLVFRMFGVGGGLLGLGGDGWILSGVGKLGLLNGLMVVFV